jgi:hypothetical protein
LNDPVYQDQRIKTGPDALLFVDFWTAQIFALARTVRLSLTGINSISSAMAAS